MVYGNSFMENERPLWLDWLDMLGFEDFLRDWMSAQLGFAEEFPPSQGLLQLTGG